MKIEVKDYHDVCEIEEYWRGVTFSKTNKNNRQKYFDEMMKWHKFRNHLEELAGVKEGEND